MPIAIIRAPDEGSIDHRQGAGAEYRPGHGGCAVEEAGAPVDLTSPHRDARDVWR
jgi:hypothetical protein